MATTPSVLVSGVVMTGSAVTYYTAPAAVRVRVTNATVTNTTAGGLPLTLHRVASGGAAGVGNTVVSAKTVGAGETYNCPELIGKVLAAGDFLQAIGNGMSLDVSGLVTSV